MKTNILCGFVLLVGAIQMARAQTATQAKSTDYAAEGARIVQELAASQFANVTARFDARMEKDLPQAKLSAMWAEMLAKAGPFQKVTATEVKAKLGGYHVVAMTCAFDRAPQNDSLVTFDDADRIAGLYFGPRPTEEVKQWDVPSYAAPARFDEVPITVTTGPWHLPGTLSLPKGNGPFPAVVLVTGSPPVDQDVTVGPNKVFKDLAWGLASRGIAVLRYTKRTCQFGAGLGGGSLSSFTVREELADDVCSALAILTARRDLDHRHTYLIGHSLGGIVASQIAADDPRVSGIVILGAPSSDPITLLLERTEDASPGGKEAAADASISTLKKLRRGEVAAGRTVEIFGERGSAGYFLELSTYEPGPATAKLKIPAMVLLGGHDSQLTDKEVERWKKVLAGKKDAALKLYPGLFHLFMPSTATGKGDTPADWMRPSHVSQEVVDDTATWILSQGKKR